MMHDKFGGSVPDLPPLQRPRKKAPRREWHAGDYSRPDWDVDHLVEMLERRARGYNGLLRSVLCTAAQRLRDQNAALRAQEQAQKEISPEELRERAETGEFDGQGGGI